MQAGFYYDLLNHKKAYFSHSLVPEVDPKMSEMILWIKEENPVAIYSYW